MLTIFLNWIYILFTVFSLGFTFSRFVRRALCYQIKRVDSILMTGLVIATVYAQVFSLFYRVNVEANVILTAVCVLLCNEKGDACFYTRLLSGMLPGRQNTDSGFAGCMVLFYLQGLYASGYG